MSPTQTPKDLNLAVAEKKIAAVVVNYCGWQDTVACVESLLRSNRPLQWIIIVDNASPGDSMRCLQGWAAGTRLVEYERWPGEDCEPAPKPLTMAVLSEQTATAPTKLQPSVHPHCILLGKNKNTGYAGGNNRGIELGLKLGADAFWILNNDTIVHPDACEALLRRASTQEKVGLVGCCVRYMQYPDMVQCCAGGYTNTWTLLSKMTGQAMSLEEALGIPPEEVEQGLNFIYGASFLVTRQFVDEIGLMDERFFMYCEEQDWALRAGDFALGYAPDAHVLHKEGATTGLRIRQYPLKRLLLITRSRLLLAAKHFPHHLPVALCGIAYGAGRIALRKALTSKYYSCR